MFCSASRNDTPSRSFRSDDLENLLDDLRRKAHRRLIEQDHLRPRHQRAADRAHLLLAAGGVARKRLAPLGEFGEIFIDQLHVPAGSPPAVAPGEGAGEQVLLDGEVGETLAAFHHLDAAAPNQFVRRLILHFGALEHNGALGDVAAFGCSRLEIAFNVVVLPAPLAPSSATMPPWHVERDALEHQDDAIIDHLDVVDRSMCSGCAAGVAFVCSTADINHAPLIRVPPRKGRGFIVGCAS